MTAAKSHEPPDDVGERGGDEQRATAQQELALRRVGRPLGLADRLTHVGGPMAQQRPPRVVRSQLGEGERSPPAAGVLVAEHLCGAGWVSVDRAHVGCPRHHVVLPEAIVELAVLSLPQVLPEPSVPVEQAAFVGKPVEEPLPGGRVGGASVVKQQMSRALASGSGPLHRQDARHGRRPGVVGPQPSLDPTRLGDAVGREERHERRGGLVDRDVASAARQKSPLDVDDGHVDSAGPQSRPRIAAARVHHHDLGPGHLLEQRASRFLESPLGPQAQNSAGELGGDVGHGKVR